VIVEWMLPGDLTAARAAREHVAAELDRRGIDGTAADDAVIVVSELAANAVRHGAPPIRLRLDFSPARLRITVTDHGDVPDPRVVLAAPDAGHGRGLAMVAALAADTGWARDGDELAVWAELPISPGR
jgi:anti-sigma regulatory factor (Ser/Thr protein kinase)